MTGSFQKSKELYEQATQLMPGGVSSPVRAFKSVGGSPIYFKQAQGAYFQDEDENSYLDMCMSWGPLILGHAQPAIISAVQEAVPKGLSFGACCRKEIQLAQWILGAFEDMQQVRFVNSGTEAVMTAIRLARGITGRSKILKFEGGYHGHFDSLLVKAGSGLATFGVSSSAGVPIPFAHQTVVCPFDDEAAVTHAFDSFKNELAAVILEPLPANNGLLEQRPEWLRHLAEQARKHGTLLIADEVITGFRFRFGGYSQALGLKPDLVTLGKIIGGGMPIGAVLGRREHMQQLAPLGGVYQAGTLSGNPVSLSAGIQTLTELSQADVYQNLEALGSQLDEAFAKLRDRFDFFNWRRVGSIFWLYLSSDSLPRRADAIDTNMVERFNRIHAPLLKRGIYLPPSAYEVCFLSTPHRSTDLNRLAESLEKVMEEAFCS